MRPIVVEDKMHVQLRRDPRRNRVEERAEFTAALPTVQLPDHLARNHVQNGKQRSSPVAQIGVRTSLDLRWAHRQQRSRPVQCLNLCFLIHTQHQRLVRLTQVQVNDTSDLPDKERILGEFASFGPMRLQSKDPPDTAGGTLTEAAGVCHSQAILQ